MTRFFFWLFAAGPVLVWGQKPNILFIISDDQSPVQSGGEQPGGQDPELGSLGPTRHPLQPLLQPRLVVGSGMRGQSHHADHRTKAYSVPPRTSPTWTSGPIPGEPSQSRIRPRPSCGPKSSAKPDTIPSSPENGTTIITRL